VENERVILIAAVSNSTRGARRLGAVAYLGFVLTGIVNTLLGPILPVLAARWILSDSRSGYFFAIQFFGSILGVGISTLLLPRRGFRYCLGLAYLLMAVGVSCLALVQLKFALLGTLTLGMGFGLAIPITNVLISNTNQDRRASALSILNFCWGIGAVFAPIALSAAVRRNLSSAFVLCLSGFLLLFAIVLAFLSGGEPSSQNDDPSERGRTQVPWHFAAIVGGMFFLYVAVETSIGGWIATLVERVPSPGAHNWSLAPSLFWTGLLAGRGVAPLILRRVSESRVVMTGLLVAGLAMFVLVVSYRWQLIIAAGFVIGFGLAAVFPITIAQLSRFQNAEKQSAGPMFALAGLGGATMPWLVGAVSTWFGSLQAGLMVPIVGTGALVWLHAIGHPKKLPGTECADKA
jgi:FHS family glucose/mannose:H+ symporter-like MFS transporter